MKYISMSILKNRSAFKAAIIAGCIKARLIFLSLYLLLIVSLFSVKAQNLLPETSPKYRVTRQVFDRLTYVFANSRPQPQLEIIASKSNQAKIIAQYKPGNRPLVQLSEEVYDLCTKLGKDSLHALAVLLSHELAHHYEKHDWYYTFGIGLTDSNTSKDKEEIERFEAEADFYGCFYGELAGFATGRVFSQIIDLVYQRFNLADQLHGYPTKEERKAIYDKKQTEAIQMVAVFKAGQFLYLMQDFAYAADCFDYLINRFPSREILNNLSAAKLQQALVLFNSHEQPGLVYPVELDAQSRLAGIHRASPTAFNVKKFQLLLGEARKYAEKAREIDPGYIPAYINLACMYSLQGNQAAAIGVINELDQNQLTGNAYTARAIAYYKDHQMEKAQRDFTMAQQKNGYMASYNLALFNQLNESMIGSITGWIKSWFDHEANTASSHKSNRNETEQIGGVAASTPLPAQASQVKIREKPYLAVQWKDDNGQVQLGIQALDFHYLIRSTGETYTGKTAQGVKCGSSQKDLFSRYGEPTYTFPGISGEYWVYQNQKNGV